MSQSFPLVPNLEQLRKRAKDLLRLVTDEDEDAMARIANCLPARDLGEGFALSKAQLVIAREHGFASWPQLKKAVEERSQTERTERVSRAHVARYVLQVEFSKMPQPPFDPAAQKDLRKLTDAIGEYHPPRNSPSHLYAAITDVRLQWYDVEIPVEKLLMGPGQEGLHADLAGRAAGFVSSFARLAGEHAEHPDIAPYLVRRPMEFPIIPTAMVDYRHATPWLPEAKADHGDVYRLLDGYHRTVAMALQGCRTIRSYVGIMESRAPWRGNYAHLDRWDGTRWIPRASKTNE